MAVTVGGWVGVGAQGGGVGGGGEGGGDAGCQLEYLCLDSALQDKMRRTT